MKKTIPISIAQTLFYIEEDTYEKLNTYLSEIQKYFSTYEDKVEIIQDIESRIREQLVEFSERDKTERIITSAHVDALIVNMGWPKEFSGFEGGNTNNTTREQSTQSQEETFTKKPRRLYRSKDNAIIGGVAAGMATYLGINITFLRILFVLFTIFHGVGVIIYIVLWFALPIADTATEILEMKGSPLNLDGVKKILEEKVNEVGGKEHMKNNAKSFFENARNMIIRVFGKIFKVIGTIIGVCLKIGSVIGVTAISVFTFVAIMPIGQANPESVFNQFHTLPYYYVFVMLAFIGAVIPCSFIGNVGNVFLGKKLFNNTQKAVVMFSIWIAAMILGPLLFATVGNAYADRINANIESARITESKNIHEFTKLTVKNGLVVHITQGATTSLEVRGSRTGIDKLTLSETSGSLTLEQNNTGVNFCFFCQIPGTEVFITTPDVGVLVAENGSRVDGTLHVDALDIDMRNASRITLEGTSTSLKLRMENASRIDAENFVVGTAHVNLSNASRATLNTTGEITGTMSNGSDIEQYGKGVNH